MKLAQLQQSLQNHVLGGEPTVEVAIQNEIVTDERLPASARLGIYAEGYAARLVEVLGESFPAVRAALGAQRFARYVSDFARRQPSRFRSARAYGEDLPQWLAVRLAGSRAQGIADLGRFEWAVAGAFDAADQAALGPESLSGVAPACWSQLQFVFTPSVRRLSVTSNCVAWWKFACAAGSRPDRWRATCTQQWLVWRRELAVFYRRLSAVETQALDAALAGRPFGEWCEQLAGPSDARGGAAEAAARAAGLLKGWFNEGLISGASVTPQMD